MSWKPISSTVPQYHTAGSPASGYFLKFYEAGTTTAVNMATDSGGGTTLAKCQINAEGYPINGSSAVFIPHVGISKYKLALYLNATDADNNTTGSAAWVVDNITTDLPNVTTYELGSTASGLSHNGIAVGHIIETSYHDANRVSNSGGRYRYTGTTDAADAGNWPHTDGYFYDNDGKQFQAIGDLYVERWGALRDGSNDYQSFSNAVQLGEYILMSEGTYTWTGTNKLEIPSGGGLIGMGKSKTFISHAVKPADDAYGNPVHITLGSNTYTSNTLPALSADIVRGDDTVTFATAHGLAVGDVFIVQNTTNRSLSTYRDHYQMGQMFEVLEVTSSTEVATTESALFDLAVADVTNYKNTSTKGSKLQGFTLTGYNGTDDETVGVEFISQRSPEARDLTITGPHFMGLTFQDGCYNFVAENVDVLGTPETTAGASLQYGLRVDNSSNGRFSNCRSVAGRHGIDGGGSRDPKVPCANVTVTNSYFSARWGNAMSTHGNCLRWTFANNIVEGTAISLRGGLHTYSGNRFVIKEDIADTCISVSEIFDPHIQLIGNTFDIYDNKANLGSLLEWAGNSNGLDAGTARDGVFVIDSNLFVVRAGVTTNPLVGMDVVNRGAVDVEIDLHVDNNKIISEAGGQTYAVNIQKGGYGASVTSDAGTATNAVEIKSTTSAKRDVQIDVDFTTGSGVGTVTLEGSNDETNWSDVATYTTDQTALTYNDGLSTHRYYRLRCQSGNYTSGTIQMDIEVKTPGAIFNLGFNNNVCRDFGGAKTLSDTVIDVRCTGNDLSGGTLLGCSLAGTGRVVFRDNDVVDMESAGAYLEGLTVIARDNDFDTYHTDNDGGATTRGALAVRVLNGGKGIIKGNTARGQGAAVTGTVSYTLSSDGTPTSVIWVDNEDEDAGTFTDNSLAYTGIPAGLSGSVTWDPGSIADGDEEAKEVTVTGAALGDYCLVSFSLDVTDLVLTGEVSAADTVTAVLANNTGGAIDLDSGTLRARVFKP